MPPDRAAHREWLGGIIKHVDGTEHALHPVLQGFKQLIETAEDLKGRRIGLVSLTDAIDTSSPGGMLVFHMLGAIAEFERALIRERTAAGLMEARRKGRVGGRPQKIEAKLRLPLASFR